MELLLSLVTGGNGIFVGIAAVIAAIAGAWLKGRSSGVKSERAKQTAGKLAAAEDRLEMDREATDIERLAAGMTDEQARDEAMKWSKR